MQKYSLCMLLLLLSQPGFAETRVYQTAPKLAPLENQQQIAVPLISVSPDSGRARIFITPDGSFSNRGEAQNAPLYHARTSYTPTVQGLSSSVIKLHQQMIARCPQGWIKRQEWATLQSSTPELHYHFQCLYNQSSSHSQTR